MRVLVYVEGPSDKLAMEALFEQVIQCQRAAGCGIEFFPATKGDRKAYLLTEVPKKAVNILLNDPDSVVAVAPDLYPRNKAFPHETVGEMSEGIIRNFKEALRAKQKPPDERWLRRFRVFCFKHELEALLLAAEEGLKQHLQAPKLKLKWTVPVEDQDHDEPPKKIVERLFHLHKRRYIDTIHAASILRRSSIDILAERCPQCFRPFAEFMKSPGEFIR